MTLTNHIPGPRGSLLKRRSRVCLWLLALAGCISPLDQFSDYSGGQVVISGQITPDAETSIVVIGRTADTERLPVPISGAIVQVVDDLQETGNFEEAVDLPGSYVLQNFQGSPGRSYTLKVILPNGRSYESLPERMPGATGRDNIYYTLEPREYVDGDGIVNERHFINIFTDFTPDDSDDPQFIRWHTEESYILSPTDFPDPFGDIPPPCFIRQAVDPQRIVLASTENMRVSALPAFFIASRRIDASFKERHYFTVYQTSITREAFEYWKKVDVVANQVGSIFDTPPARIKGNMKSSNSPEEVVHGYFQAGNQVFTRFYLLPRDLPFALPEHCEYRGDRDFRSYPSECLNCLSVRNSSYNRPAWF